MTDFTKPGYYRTRDGRKAEVLKHYADDSGGYPIKGAIHDREEWIPTAWKVTGSFLGRISSRDLIAPWEEKKTYDLSKMWAVWYVAKDGRIYKEDPMFPSREDALQYFKSRKVWWGEGSYVITPATATTFTEGEGLE